MRPARSWILLPGPCLYLSHTLESFSSNLYQSLLSNWKLPWTDHLGVALSYCYLVSVKGRLMPLEHPNIDLPHFPVRRITAIDCCAGHTDWAFASKAGVCEPEFLLFSLCEDWWQRLLSSLGADRPLLRIYYFLLHSLRCYSCWIDDLQIWYKFLVSYLDQTNYAASFFVELTFTWLLWYYLWISSSTAPLKGSHTDSILASEGHNYFSVAIARRLQLLVIHAGVCNLADVVLVMGSFNHISVCYCIYICVYFF